MLSDDLASCERGRVLRQRCSTLGAMVECANLVRNGWRMMMATFCVLDVFALLVHRRCYICVELHCRCIYACLGAVVSSLLNMIDDATVEVSFFSFKAQWTCYVFRG